MNAKDTSSVLSALFSYLDQMEFKYCVLGRTSELPDKVPSDIDIVIDSNPLKVIHSFTRDFSRPYDLKGVQILQHEQSAYFFVLTWNSRDGKLKFIHPDILR